MSINDITEDEADDDPRVIAAVKQYQALLDSGSPPTQDAFLEQHADIAEQLRPSLEGLALIHRVAEPRSAGMASAPDLEFTAKPIGDFQIVGELGRGGMGVVYEAIQLSLGRRVALKVLPFASGLDEIRLQRFRNEAHAAAQLHHTNIVPVYAVGSDRGIHYYAMQLIDGHTLTWLIDNMRQANGKGNAAPLPATEDAVGVAFSQPRTASAFENHRNAGNETIAASTTILSGANNRRRYYESVVRMTHQAALAIEHAHRYGVIHRDIKPGNLLLDAAGKIWVTDFGLAQVQQAESQLTHTGDAIGTLRYMSPEQASGDRAIMDHRTDIYSLGVTLYELLTLEPAIDGAGYHQMLNQVVEHEPATPKSIEPSLPIELDTIVRKAISKLPGERYATAQGFADDLQRWLDDKPILARPPTTLERMSKWRRRNSLLVNGAAALLLLASIGLLATTLLVWREQRRTRLALDRETEQRQAAEASFQQARLAVDTFSSLSESELAYRPELQDLRRSFLETSLEFYRDFVQQRKQDREATEELAATSERVERMVEQLQVLDKISPLWLLSDTRVQQELKVDPARIDPIVAAIRELQDAMREVANQGGGLLESSNEAMAVRLREFDAFMTTQLDSGQLKRLRQISRQDRLPLTFKTSEVVAALGLSREQRETIGRIIQEGRPGRGGPGPDDHRAHEGPLDGPRQRRDAFPGFAFDGSRPDGFRPDGPPPNGIGGDGPPRFVQEMTQQTVDRILDVLTADQRAIWKDLVGEPFEMRGHRRFG
ncbi:serine/threonine protein kinase [Novipirellula artificiosorum]|uniref:non-specific serine/threonine protein kinase n=1 Tax=Novipirellula artificiosorum TaxID=2528016 RepID=A0A5C6CZ29_9BACT|nr:serine/threonine-protein kinase [Novipirellula artificiosorum]TWU28747.1 Serine/threonine-protein kinase PrkC [Novipirellula artificiosorum]